PRLPTGIELLDQFRRWPGSYLTTDDTVPSALAGKYAADASGKLYWSIIPVRVSHQASLVPLHCMEIKTCCRQSEFHSWRVPIVVIFRIPTVVSTRNLITLMLDFLNTPRFSEIC